MHCSLLLEYFWEQLGKHPNDVAVCDADNSLTYCQLDDISTRIAITLIQAENTTVAVLTHRTVDIVVGALAAMKVGAAFMPVDEAYPQDRIDYMLKDSDAKYLLTTQDLWQEKELEYPKEQVVLLRGNFLKRDVEIQWEFRHEDDNAMILYTSGTTGRPKGVVHTDKSIESMVNSTRIVTNIQAGSQLAVVAGFSFIASQFLIFTSLMTGSTIHIVDNITRQDVDLLHSYLQSRRIDCLFLPPMLATLLVEEYDSTGVTILSAGDKLRNFNSKGTSTLINMYGSTEGVIVIAGQVYGNEEIIPLGKPLPGVTVDIVDENHASVPEGEIGELIYSSYIQAKEYLNLPEQTSEKWFNDASGKRWFSTGDRVRRGPDGNIYYLGRSDNMVKIHGFRVETGEVERQISFAVPSIDVAVVLRSVHGIDHLVCFYQAPSPIDIDAIRNVLTKTLPDYMVPDIWVRMDTFPRNANGKVMRNQLPIPSVGGDRLSVMYNEVELRIVEAAKLVVGDMLSLDDNFFECGGTSLGAMRLSTLLKAMGIRISGSQIMQLKVLRRLAAEAEVDYARLWSEDQYRDIVKDFSKRGEVIQKVLPLSNEQEDLLFRYLMSPDSTASRNVFVLQLDSHIDTQLLCDAINDVSQQYEMLRSSIVIHHRAPFQQVITDRRLELDICAIPDGQSVMQGVKEIYQQLLHLPFDPEISELVHFAYVDLPEGGSFLFVLVHNISFSICMARQVIYDIMQILSVDYPCDMAIDGWRDLMELALDQADVSNELMRPNCLLQEVPKPCKNELIRTYTPQRQGVPSVVFIHTGNTGSDAYFQLADKIGEFCSFSVIEPYNLFHHDDIQHGIPAIAHKYVEILRQYQPQGPYILGGWCYGGVVAHEMACQLQADGQEVSHLIMFDSHALVNEHLIGMAKVMHSKIDRKYFEECPLFQDLREQGLLDDMVRNSVQVSYDLLHHTPSFFHGSVTYFKPQQVPVDATGMDLEYWKEMMRYDAGNYENYCDRTQLQIIDLPHEHDLMMDDTCLQISVPVLRRLLTGCK